MWYWMNPQCIHLVSMSEVCTLYMNGNPQMTNFEVNPQLATYRSVCDVIDVYITSLGLPGTSGTPWNVMEREGHLATKGTIPTIHGRAVID